MKALSKGFGSLGLAGMVENKGVKVDFSMTKVNRGWG